MWKINSYILKSRIKGFSYDIIYQKLVDSGYPEDVAKSLVRKFKLKTYFAISIVILIIFSGSVYIAINLLKPMPNYSYSGFQKERVNMSYYMSIFNKIDLNEHYKWGKLKTSSPENYKKLDINNPSFDYSEDNGPHDWLIIGNVKYTSKNCKSGRCLILKGDATDDGVAFINSKPIDIQETDEYYFTEYEVYCKKCRPQTAYLTFIYLDESGKEFTRDIYILDENKGYEKIKLYATPPENASSIIFGLRVHTESAHVSNNTEVYIDS